MAKQKLPYVEGTWFSLPLRNGGCAVGIAARFSGEGGMFGYFFGPKRGSPPALNELATLSASDACWMGCFGDLGLLNGEWRIIGQHPNWNRANWPLPQFICYDEIGDTAQIVEYSEDLELVSVESCDPELRHVYPRDAASGYGAVEIRLTRLLDPEWNPV